MLQINKITDPDVILPINKIFKHTANYGWQNEQPAAFRPTPTLGIQT
jgi:hypothetical protein